MSMFDLQCPVCDANHLKKLEIVNVERQHLLYTFRQDMQNKLTEAAKESALQYQMFRCLNCQLEFATPALSPNALWYDLAYEVLDLYPGDRWEFKFVIQRIKQNENILELACGSGEFLKICRANNISAKGLDFAPEAVKQCLAAGLNAELFDLSHPFQGITTKIKNITAFHILEHLSDPNSLFRYASALASNETLLWVSLPSDLRPSRVLNEVDFLDQPPHHMSRWNKEAFAKVGNKNGWTLQDVFYEPISNSSANWWISTRMKIYQSLQKVLAKNQLIERGFRFSIYPITWILRQTKYKRMQGFTMLALYSYN